MIRLSSSPVNRQSSLVARTWFSIQILIQRAVRRRTYTYSTLSIRASRMCFGLLQLPWTARANSWRAISRSDPNENGFALCTNLIIGRISSSLHGSPKAPRNGEFKNHADEARKDERRIWRVQGVAGHTMCPENGGHGVDGKRQRDVRRRRLEGTCPAS
jgi:hypothetical protein